jgi:CheY-like chemotaxis protein
MEHSPQSWELRGERPDSPATILIADDEDAIRTSLSLVLEEFGYAVRSVENGIAALFEIGQLIPDILLSDLNKPGMSGYPGRSREHFRRSLP